MEGLPRWVTGELVPWPQQGEATYSRVLRKGDGRLDWQLPARELWLRVRAFQPWPGTFTAFRDRLLKVLEVEPAAGSTPPGMVVGVNGGAAVGTGEGVLRLLRVQLEGKRPLNIEEFLRGRPDLVGATLGQKEAGYG
jgi:methionyl-tRNA formyltransferase